MSSTTLAKKASPGALLLRFMVSKFDALRYLPSLANGFLRFNSVGQLIADNAPMNFLYKAAAYTAAAGDRIALNTTAGAISITLPATPTAGDTVLIFDAAGTFDTNNLTVLRNGEKINSAAADLTVAAESALVSLVYVTAAIGWAAVYQASALASLAVSGNASVGGTLDVTGAATIGSVEATAATPFLRTPAGKTNTGYVQVLGKTSGGLKVTVADASASLVTATLLAQTVGPAALSIPNFASVADTFAFVTLAQEFANKTMTAQVVKTGLSASGSATNDFSGSTGAFKTSTGLNTVGGKQALKVIAAPVAAAGAGGGMAGAAALGSANIVAISSDGATKGVKLLTGVAGDVVQIVNTSGTAANLFAASGGTINGGVADAGCAIPASKGVIAICTAADTWFVFDMAARAGAAA